MAVPEYHRHRTTITRHYIDTRSLVPSIPKQPYTLPLLSTLQFADQEAVTRFIRPADRFMSLASALLKYTFIHRHARIPWSEVQVSRTPAPHRRPYWSPPSDWDPSGTKGGLEFNVSHQAGLVAIIGCDTPTAQGPEAASSTAPPDEAFDRLDLVGHHHHQHTPEFDHHRPSGQVRLGVDIACTDEDKRTPKDMTTQAKFDEWVDIFGEMFSDRERRDMRHAPVHLPVIEREEGAWPSSSSSSSSEEETSDAHAAKIKRQKEMEAKIVQMKLRRFYAYWGLKEAYIKMVGEGLLASWLRELEFINVVAPKPWSILHGRSSSRSRSRSRSGNRVENGHPNFQHHHHHYHHHRSSTASHHAHQRSSSDGTALLSPLEPGSSLSSPLSPTSRAADDKDEDEAKWTAPSNAERGMTTLFQGKEVQDIDISIVAYDDEFLVATAIRGVEEIAEKDPSSVRHLALSSTGGDHVHGSEQFSQTGSVGGQHEHADVVVAPLRRWIRLDIERDIMPCATGTCRCLD